MKRGRIFGAVATFALAGALACAGCAGGGQGASTDAGKASVLDPADPVQVELWTYYNGTQQQAFEDLVKEFNAGRGKDTGVVVTSSSQGKFRSDAVKTGDLVCYVGSSSSVVYFPKTVPVDDNTR